MVLTGLPISSETTADTEDQVSKLELELQEMKDKYLRQVAEFDLGGLSKKAIADYLGDLSPKATSIHAKADLNRLRQVAEFDLGGLS